MANKRTKTTQFVQKQANAKRACQKKQKMATKSKNDQLRQDLDCQMQAVYLTQQVLPQSFPDVAEPQLDSVNDLLTSITKL